MIGIVKLSFNLDGISSIVIATIEPDRIIIGDKDWLMRSTIKKEVINLGLIKLSKKFY